MKTSIIKAVYKAIQNELKRKYPTENDWEMFVCENISNESKNVGEPISKSDLEFIYLFYFCKTQGYKPLKRSNVEYHQIRSHAIYKIYRDENQSENEKLNMDELKSLAKYAELDCEMIRQDDYISFVQQLKNKHLFSKFNSSFGSVLHQIKHFDIREPGGLLLFDRWDDGGCDFEIRMKFDLLKDNETFKVLAKAIEYLPIDEDLCKQTQLEIKKYQEHYMVLLKEFMLKEIKEGSETVEYNIEQLEQFYNDRSKLEQYKDDKVNMSSIKEDIKTSVGPILEQLKRLEILNENQSEPVINADNQNEDMITDTIQVEKEPLIEKKTPEPEGPKTRNFLTAIRSCFCLENLDENN